MRLMKGRRAGLLPAGNAACMTPARLQSGLEGLCRMCAMVQPAMPRISTARPSHHKTPVIIGRAVDATTAVA